MMESQTTMEQHVAPWDVGAVVEEVVVAGLVEGNHVVLVVFLKNKYVEFKGTWHLVICKVTNTHKSFKF